MVESNPKMQQPTDFGAEFVANMRSSAIDFVKNHARSVAVVAVAGLSLASCARGEAASTPGTTPPGTTVGTEVHGTTPGTNPEVVCADSWAVAEVDDKDTHRFFADGIQEIKDAQTPQEARDALKVWTDKVKVSPKLLSGASKGMLKEDVPASELQDADGKCASPKAKEVVTALEAKFAISDVKASEAPTDGTNSGVDADGNVVVDEQAGVTGDRKSVEVSDPDTGEKVDIMARCGNLVFRITPPNIPKGPTDNPHPPAVTTTSTTEFINAKRDNGNLPGDGTPASKDKGTPDKPGVGPVGQPTDPDGYTPTETRPSYPTKTTATTSAPKPTTPATTGPQPTSTNPPQTATTSVSTTAPQNKPLPTQP